MRSCWLKIEGVDSNLCCGTHVNNLAHLQAIKLVWTESKAWNLTYIDFIKRFLLLYIYIYKYIYIIVSVFSEVSLQPILSLPTSFTSLPNSFRSVATAVWAASLLLFDLVYLCSDKKGKNLLYFLVGNRVFRYLQQTIDRERGITAILR